MKNHLNSTPLLITSLALSLAALFWQVAPVLAGPPAPVIFWLTQPDGTTRFQARTWGDEHFYGTETTDGYTIVVDTDTGYWVYAQVDRSGHRLIPTNYIVGQDPPPASARLSRLSPLETPGRNGGRGPIGSGTIPVLVLMVQYNDHPAQSSESDWVNVVFGPINSVKDYYREVSYHQLTLVPAAESCGSASNDGLTGWLTLGTTHPNAGGPSIALAALKAAESCINYAAFDTDSDQKITSKELLPLIIVAGYETSYGGAVALKPNLWGHQGALNYHSVSDGVTLNTYGQFGEWHAADYDPVGHIATIGLIVHEIGHLLGWPDLYDIIPPGNPDAEGVGEWSVMGSGLWLGSLYLGDTPAHPSAWEKWYQGWLTPTPLNGVDISQALLQVETYQEGGVIQLGENPHGVDWSFEEKSGVGEYFLVENRQRIGYDARLPGCGLLVWHIDESLTFHNTANSNETHKLVDLEEADGLAHLDHQLNRGDAGDPFPGSSNRTLFNLFSNPNSRLYNGQASGIRITNISPGCSAAMPAIFTSQAPPQLRVTLASLPVIIETTTTAITYTLTVYNDGEGNATQVVVTNTIPAGTTYVPGSAGSGAETTPGSGLITWPPLTVGAASKVNLTFRVNVQIPLMKGDNLINRISISSAQGVNLENIEQSHRVGGYQLNLPVLHKKS